MVGDQAARPKAVLTAEVEPDPSLALQLQCCHSQFAVTAAVVEAVVLVRVPKLQYHFHVVVERETEVAEEDDSADSAVVKRVRSSVPRVETVQGRVQLPIVPGPMFFLGVSAAVDVVATERHSES